MGWNWKTDVIAMLILLLGPAIVVPIVAVASIIWLKPIIALLSIILLIALTCCLIYILRCRKKTISQKTSKNNN